MASIRHLDDHSLGERKKQALRVDFGRLLKVEIHGTKVTTDAVILFYRELDDVWV
jgi:hypothetical protein